MLDYIGSCIAAFCLSLFFLWLLMPAAVHVGLVDNPNHRKHHSGAVPLVGGIAMFCGFLLSVLLLPQPLSGLRTLFAGMAVMVIIGVLDDFHEVSTSKRFAAQILSALIMALIGGVVLYDFGSIGITSRPVELGWLALPVTVFGVVGVINALNMADGMDGMAGGLTLIAFVYMAAAAGDAGLFQQLNVLLLLIAALSAFLLFNLPLPGRRQAKAFMGDGGSMFLGFALAWFFIGLSQGEQRAFSPVTALWLFALPLLDTVSIMLRRLLRGRSPFAPDREHFHHILLLAGFSSRQALVIVLFLATFLGAVGMTGFYFKVPEVLMFYAFLTLFAVYFAGMLHAWKVYRFLGRSLKSPSVVS